MKFSELEDSEIQHPSTFSEAKEDMISLYWPRWKPYTRNHLPVHGSNRTYGFERGQYKEIISSLASLKR
jgi:hypothetical protein